MATAAGTLDNHHASDDSSNKNIIWSVLENHAWPKKARDTLIAARQRLHESFTDDFAVFPAQSDFILDNLPLCFCIYALSPPAHRDHGTDCILCGDPCWGCYNPSLPPEAMHLSADQGRVAALCRQCYYIANPITCCVSLAWSHFTYKTMPIDYSYRRPYMFCSSVSVATDLDCALNDFFPDWDDGLDSQMRSAIKRYINKAENRWNGLIRHRTEFWMVCFTTGPEPANISVEAVAYIMRICLEFICMTGSSFRLPPPTRPIATLALIKIWRDHPSLFDPDGRYGTSSLVDMAISERNDKILAFVVARCAPSTIRGMLYRTPCSMATPCSNRESHFNWCPLLVAIHDIQRNSSVSLLARCIPILLSQANDWSRWHLDRLFVNTVTVELSRVISLLPHEDDARIKVLCAARDLLSSIAQAQQNIPLHLPSTIMKIMECPAPIASLIASYTRMPSLDPAINAPLLAR